MSYPEEMKKSVDRATATRSQRVKESFPSLLPEEKATLLERHHPDYRPTGMREISLGVNKGDRAVHEFVDILEAHSRIDPGAIDLGVADQEVDVLTRLRLGPTSCTARRGVFSGKNKPLVAGQRRAG